MAAGSTAKRAQWLERRDVRPAWRGTLASRQREPVWNRLHTPQASSEPIASIQVAAFRKTFWPGPLYFDADKTFYKALHGGELRRGTLLVFANPFSAAWRNTRRASKTVKESNLVGDGLTMGGLLIVRTDGSVAFKHVEEEFGQHASCEKVRDLRCVRSLAFVLAVRAHRRSCPFACGHPSCAWRVAWQRQILRRGADSEGSRGRVDERIRWRVRRRARRVSMEAACSSARWRLGFVCHSCFRRAVTHRCLRARVD